MSKATIFFIYLQLCKLSKYWLGQFKVEILLYFAILLPIEQKPNIRSEMNILFKNLYVEKILVSVAFHTVDPTFRTK